MRFVGCLVALLAVLCLVSTADARGRCGRGHHCGVVAVGCTGCGGCATMTYYQPCQQVIVQPAPVVVAPAQVTTPVLVVPRCQSGCCNGGCGGAGLFQWLHR